MKTLVIEATFALSDDCEIPRGREVCGIDPRLECPGLIVQIQVRTLNP